MRLRILICLLAISIAACRAQNTGVQQPPAPGPSGQPPGVQVVDQAQWEAMRAAGQYVFSDPRGDVAATAACASGSADDACLEAARKTLRDEAVRRGANLVVVTRVASGQSFPVQISMAGVLYEISPRR